MPYSLVSTIRGSQQQARVVAWSPTDDANMVVWFDYSDKNYLFTDAGGTTPVVNDSDAVYRVGCKLGGSYYILQSNATYKPAYRTNVKNGRDALQFVGDYMTDINTGMPTLGTSYTAWGAIQVASSGGTQLKQLWLQTTPQVWAGIDGNVPSLYFRSGAASSLNASIPALGNWFRYLITHNGSTNDTNMYINGSLITNGAGGTAALNLGVTTYWGANNALGNIYHGYWGEMGFRTGVADSTLIGNINTYLANKWAL